MKTRRPGVFATLLLACVASGCSTEPNTHHPAASDTRTLVPAKKYETTLRPAPGQTEQEAAESTVITR